MVVQRTVTLDRTLFLVVGEGGGDVRLCYAMCYYYYLNTSEMAPAPPPPVEDSKAGWKRNIGFFYHSAKNHYPKIAKYQG